MQRLIAQFVKRARQPADFAQLPTARLRRQAERLTGARADLGEFAAQHTPINERAFDYLDVLLRMVPAVALEEPASAVHSPSAQDALGAAVDALRAVLFRAEACGRPLRLFELSLPPWSEAGLVAQLLRVVQAGRRRADKWDAPEQARVLFDTLEKAALALEVAWALPVTRPAEDETGLRRAATQQLLYDAVTYLSAYGRAVFWNRPKRRERYLLRDLHPAASAGTLQPLTQFLSG